MQEDVTEAEMRMSLYSATQMVSEYDTLASFPTERHLRTILSAGLGRFLPGWNVMGRGMNIAEFYKKAAILRELNYLPPIIAAAYAREFITPEGVAMPDLSELAGRIKQDYLRGQPATESEADFMALNFMLVLTAYSLGEKVYIARPVNKLRIAIPPEVYLLAASRVAKHVSVGTFEGIYDGETDATTDVDWQFPEFVRAGDKIELEKVRWLASEGNKWEVDSSFSPEGGLLAPFPESLEAAVGKFFDKSLLETFMQLRNPGVYVNPSFWKEERERWQAIRDAGS